MMATLDDRNGMIEIDGGIVICDMASAEHRGNSTAIDKIDLKRNDGIMWAAVKVERQTYDYML